MIRTQFEEKNVNLIAEVALKVKGNATLVGLKNVKKCMLLNALIITFCIQYIGPQLGLYGYEKDG